MRAFNPSTLSHCLQVPNHLHRGKALLEVSMGSLADEIEKETRASKLIEQCSSSSWAEN